MVHGFWASGFWVQGGTCTWTSRAPKTKEPILPALSVLRYGAIMLGTLEVQVARLQVGTSILAETIGCSPASLKLPVAFLLPTLGLRYPNKG